jgi:hypothetical protein
MFSAYTNRYGKRLVLDSGLLDKFHLMVTQLGLLHVDLDITNAWRGEVEQNECFLRGNSNARWGSSPHNFGVAFDCAPIIDGKLYWPDETSPHFHVWKKIMNAGENVGLRWGNDWNNDRVMDNTQATMKKYLHDYPHWELKDWKKLPDLKLWPECPSIG